MKELNHIANKATQGDSEALEQLVNEIKDDIFNLSLRMLWHPQDAEDATQEILIKIITNLGTFKGNSQFSTWVFSVASNYLLTTRKRRAEKQPISFDSFKADFLSDWKSDPNFPEAERRLYEREVKVGCTHAMLLCLDRPHRLVFVLSSIFSVSGADGAEILGIKPEAFRKRSSRAQIKMREFMKEFCGLVDPSAKCSCYKRVDIAIQNKRFNPQNPDFLPLSITSESMEHYVSQMEQLDQSAIALRSNPFFKSPDRINNQIRKILQSADYNILH